VCYITYSHITSRQGSDTPLSSITTLPHSPLPSHPHSWLPSSPSTHTPFNGPFFGTTQVSRYQKGKTNLDFTGARDSDWQWHQLGRMQVCTSLQTDNHASTPPLSFLQAGCPSYRPTNSIKALKAPNSIKALKAPLLLHMCTIRPHSCYIGPHYIQLLCNLRRRLRRNHNPCLYNCHV